MTLDSYITLGNSGLRVSPFCLGTMTFGEESQFGTTTKDSQDILDCYLNEGGNFIDTANIYTRGQSEKIIGDYFASHKARRDRTAIATKFFCSLFPGDPNAGGAGRKAIFAQCDESLRRLQTDYIDLYWLHNWDKYTPIEETMKALEDLVTSGKVRYIGFSDAPAWVITQAQMISHFRGWSPLIAMQLEYSLLERTIEGEHVPMAQHLGLGILPWSPLKSGLLSGKYSRQNPIQGGRAAFAGEVTDKTYEVIDTLNTIAKEIDAKPAAVALSWLQHRPGISSTIIGVRSFEQFQANLEAFKVQLSADQIDRLDTVSQPKLNFPAEFNRKLSPMFSNAGATVNGDVTQRPSNFPKDDSNRY
jgi:aryl-alcohol dehydrogenase-like predicted oxidoreductase